MKKESILVMLSVAVLLAPLPALGFGAIAVGDPPNIATAGFAFGGALNESTANLAGEKALNACRTTNLAPESARALCTLVRTFYHQCAAVAEDPGAGTPGVGWAVAPTQEAAEQQAMDNCMATAGEARKQFCVKQSSWCDTQ